VRAQIAKRAAAGNLRIGHPTPLGVKPAFERPAMTIGKAATRDCPQISRLDLFPHKIKDRPPG